MVRGIARIGKQIIEIELAMIMDAGRKAIWNRTPVGERFEMIERNRCATHMKQRRRRPYRRAAVAAGAALADGDGMNIA